MWSVCAHRSGETPRSGRLVYAGPNPVAARLLSVRRILAIVLLALLPLQFSWAAVASYCEHEAQDAGHFGPHQHAHHADAGPSAEPVVHTDAQADQAPGDVDLDCGHCHGQCCVMPTLTAKFPGALSTARPNASSNEAGGAHAPSRPERPQWLRLA
jgi:hypothetical protein